MEQSIISILFIKISAYILLTWICHFDNDYMFRTSLDNYKLDIKLVRRQYRILVKYKQNKYSKFADLKEDMSNKVKYEKKDSYDKENVLKSKNRKFNKGLLNKAQYYTEFIDYRNGMFDGKHFHFEKKWIKKKDYDDYIEKNKRIGDIALKKIKFRKYRYGIAMLFFFFLLGIGLSISCKFEKTSGGATNNGIDNQILQFLKGILGLNNEGHVFILLFAVTFIMLSILIIIAIYKILRNNEKYQIFKLITE
ncbi:fam-m protein [Plasmodium malariae]|uniref:Fam-m protein n=1 Tax=Plasmodium malariae TaxID=5858 RepID=A0A1D3JGZ4_PLAMA|nr:fam-m protein [Plasmodium malariae]SBT85557.1 fam-m protein [Plasmodium malariae]